MTKKTLQLIATVALAAGFGFTTVTANADDTNSQSTDASVTLTPGDGTGTHDGAVSLTAAPDLAFGTHKVTGKADNFDITSGSGITTNNGSTNKDAKGGAVEVVNSGSDAGWNVTVAASDFTDKTDPSNVKTLLGATIDLKGTPETDNADVDGKTDNTLKPATIGIAAAGVGATTTVTPGEANAVPVLTAAAGNGYGTWRNQINDATLNIAGGNAAGTYSSSLTWTIANTPSTQA